MDVEGLEHEESLGPDHPGSMASKLARAEEAPQSPEEIEAARLAEQEAAAAQAEAEAAEAETAKLQAEAEEKAAALEPPKSKYASIEEAEKAANEAAAKMHTATTEAAEERKAREAAEAELATIRVEQEATAAEVAKQVPKTERKAAFAAALKQIQAIPLTTDPETGEIKYPEDYDDLVAEAWATTAVDPHEVAKEAAKLAREELSRERKAADAMTEAEKEEAARVKVRSDAEKLASTDYGLDMTPGSADYRLFYSHVDELAENPEHEYRDKPFAEQVKWAASGTRQVLGKKIEMTDAERAAARRHQDRNLVLERGVNRVITTEQPRQRSMNEILTGKSATPT
jgi:hypothetical protein